MTMWRGRSVLAFGCLAVVSRLAGVLALALAGTASALFPAGVISDHILIALRRIALSLGLVIEALVAGRDAFIHDLEETGCVS